MHALDHLGIAFPQAHANVERRVELRRGALADALVEGAQVAEVGDLVRRVDEDGPLAPRFDLVAVVLLPALVGLDVLVLRHRLDEVVDLGAERLLDLLERRVGVLDHVVEERRGQDLLVVVARGMEQSRQLRGVVDVGRAVALPLLALVGLAGELVRRPGKPRAVKELWFALLHRPGLPAS